MASVVFLESGTAATQDLSWFDSSSGTVASDTTAKYGGRSLKLTSTASVRKRSMLGNSRRITTWWQTDTISPGSDVPILKILDSVNATILQINLKTTNVLSVASGASSKAGTTGISINTWYRICVSFTVTSTTSWSCKVFLTTSNATLMSAAEISATNADFSLASSGPVSLDLIGISIATNYWNGVFVDDGTGLDDTGDIRVTAKLPNALGNANAFSTAIGSATNRWDYVSERPRSDAKGWKEIGTTQTEESYGIQDAATGDVDITGKTIIAHQSWVVAGRDVYAASYTTSVQFATKQTTTVLPSVNVTNGDWIVVAFADQILGAAVTLAKSAGTSTIGTVTALAGPTTSTVRLSKWYFQVTGTGTLTMTFTHDSSSGKRAGVLAGFVGISASPVDANPANTTDGTSQYDGPASGTLAQANELVLSLFAFAGPVGDVFAVTSADSVVVSNGTTGGTVGANATLYMLMRAVEVTTTVTAAMTNTTANRAGVQGLVSLKMSAGGADGSSKYVVDGTDITAGFAAGSGWVGVGTGADPHVTTSASYPSATAAIGIKSTGNLNDTYLYECGVLIAYDNAVVDDQSWLSRSYSIEPNRRVTQTIAY